MSKIILLDCDGVLANFAGALNKLTGTKPSDVVSWDYFSTNHKGVMRKACADREFWRALDPVPGAKEGVATLKRYAKLEGARILVCTSPWHSCDGWASSRWYWLEHHFGIKPRDVIIGSAKELIKGDVLVEDNGKTLFRWMMVQAPPGLPIIFDAPYNQDRPWLYRSTWREGLADLIIAHL